MTKKEAPLGIKIISILYYIGAVFAVISGIIVIAGGSFLSNLFGIVLTSLSILIAIFAFGFAVLGFFIGKGLWKGQSWARIVAIIFAILGVIGGLSSITVNIIQGTIYLIVDGLIGGYLLFAKEAKAHFK